VSFPILSSWISAYRIYSVLKSDRRLIRRRCRLVQLYIVSIRIINENYGCSTAARQLPNCRSPLPAFAAIKPALSVLITIRTVRSVALTEHHRKVGVPLTFSRILPSVRQCYHLKGWERPAIDRIRTFFSKGGIASNTLMAMSRYRRLLRTH